MSEWDQTLIREKGERKISPPALTNCTQETAFPHKPRPITGLRLVETAISTNPKPTTHRNRYENTGTKPNFPPWLVLLLRGGGGPVYIIRSAKSVLKFF